MSEPQQVFAEFVERYRREGTADPREYLARLEGLDREELRALIDGFLLRAPRREWDAEAFGGSLAERALARAAARELAESELAGGWPKALPLLRNRAKLKRSQVVERLAAALGFAGSEKRVEEYYHHMEQGLLAPEGVSTRVLEALGEIVGAPAGMLRRAGELGGAEAAAGGEVYARLGEPESGRPPAEPPEPEPEVKADRAAKGPKDELDRLFTGGD